MKKTWFFLSLLALSTIAFSAQVEKSLKLPAEGIAKLSVDAGAGSLDIRGEEGLTSIEVKAEINVEWIGENKLDEFLKDHLRFSLEKRDGEAFLKGYFEFVGIVLPRDATISLTVRVPKSMNLYVDDGSGELTVDNIKGEVRIDDGSGDITAENIDGILIIDDGSGGIDVRNITGDVEIDDGSGSIRVVHIGGTVTVDDGSGGISIDDVGKDVIFESTGSGSVRTGNVKGRIVR